MSKNILPKTSFPKRYEIKLDVKLEDFSYIGNQTVEMEILESTKSIFLNSLGIKISHASLIDKNDEEINLSVEYFEDDERISLSSKNEILKGNYKLCLEFKSEITNDLKGFYRSKFLNKDEAEKNGYIEIQPPILINEDSAFGTGQLPDKEGMMYKIEKRST